MNYRIEWNYWDAERAVIGDFQSIYELVNILARNPNVTRYRITTDKYTRTMGQKWPSGHWEKVESKDFGFTTQRGEY